MLELKDGQQQETEGKLQFHSGLMLMAQALVPCWIQFYLPSCFWTFWDLNKYTVIHIENYTIKYTKVQLLMEDACM